MYIVFSRVIVKKLYLFFDYVAKIHILLIIHIAQALQFSVFLSVFPPFALTLHIASALPP